MPALNGANMHEHIFAAVVRLTETEALLAVEPSYSSLRHEILPSLHVQAGHAPAQPDEFEILGKVVSLARSSRRGQVVRAETRS